MFRLVFAVAGATCLLTATGEAAEATNWYSFLLLGDQAIEARQFTKAETSFLRASEATRNDPNKAHLAAILNRLGSLYCKQGRYAAAVRMYRRVADIQEQRPEASERERINSKSNLATALHAERKFHEAEKLFIEVAESCERALNASASDIASAWNNVAAVYFEQGRLADAEEYYRRAYGLQGRATPNQLAALTIGNNLALLYAEQRKTAEAESLYQEVLTRLRAVVGNEHQSVATTLNNLGLLYRQLGRRDEAVKYVGAALEISEKLLGPMHPTSLEVARSYVIVLRQAHHKKEAGIYEARLKESGAIGKAPQTVDVTLLLRR